MKKKFKQPFFVNKIEFTAKAKKGNLPFARHCTFKINGKKMESAISYLKIEVPSSDSIVTWQIGLKEPEKDSLWNDFKKTLRHKFYLLYYKWKWKM